MQPTPFCRGQLLPGLSQFWPEECQPGTGRSSGKEGRKEGKMDGLEDQFLRSTLTFICRHRFGFFCLF